MIQGKCHFIGIGGIGMSGLARLLLSKNIKVSGSDLTSSYVIDGLMEEGAEVYLGHSSKHVSPGMTVIYTTEVARDNPEYEAALKLNCPMLHRSDLLAQLMKGHNTLAVAGTHGKTTTSALLAGVLAEAGLDPTFAVGGMIPQFKSNAKLGKGSYFVAEACESDGTFLKYSPHGAIVTNIDFDHMDYYQTEKALIRAFESFMHKVASSEHLFWCGDDTRLAKLGMPGTSYGFGAGCALRASGFRQNGWSISFDAEYRKKRYRNIQAPLIGMHNALNALAVFGLALNLGIEEKFIRSAFQKFKGVGRRCEKKGDCHGILFLDDYAHHPTEINATLRGIRNAVKERRLICVYQPHRYTRTRDCLGMYAGIFDSCDELVVTDIYPAGEQPVEGITAQTVLDEVRKNAQFPSRRVPRHQLAAFLGLYLRPHDVVVTLGAGDITKLAGEMLQSLRQNPPAKYKVGVIYGGLSAEHEVSLLSARNVLESLRMEYYDIELFGISKQGAWVYGDWAKELLENSHAVDVQDWEQGLIPKEALENLLRCDVIFPVLHGPFSEDGTLQGFFEILGKPYAGCDHRSAAVCMDKALTKKLMVLQGIRTPHFISFGKFEWSQHKEDVVKRINAELKYPVFVKPLHLGSTVGVYKVESPQELEQTVDKSLGYDTHVLVENGLDIREIEFAVLGNDLVEVYGPGEILAAGQVYSYQGKYSTQAISTDPKAKLPQELIDEGKEIARKAYIAAGCTGMARVDTFLDKHGKYWLNEINPIPGFTKNSLYPKMCEADGLSLQDLVDRLIILAFSRKRHQDAVFIPNRTKRKNGNDETV